MRKTTIELTSEQYFFLKEKALELQKQNQNACLSAERRQASIVSIIRDLVDPVRYSKLSHRVEKDWQDWQAP